MAWPRHGHGHAQPMPGTVMPVPCPCHVLCVRYKVWFAPFEEGSFGSRLGGIQGTFRRGKEEKRKHFEAGDRIFNTNQVLSISLISPIVLLKLVMIHFYSFSP